MDYTRRLNWLLGMNALWQYCHDRFLEVARGLDRQLVGYSFAERFLSPVARTRHVLRLLSYNEGLSPGQQLGKPHVDRNFGTFQVYESHPALVLELPDRRLQYQPQRDKALVFTGEKARLFTQGILKGVRHSVVVPEDFTPPACTASCGGCANKENDGHGCGQDGGTVRQSIVFFAHIHF